jgi:hypothetical protein
VCGITTLLLVRGADGGRVPQVPGAMEGDSWKIRVLALGALSLVALIVLISITAGNHRGFSRNLLQGILITGVCFVFLAVVAPYRLWRSRRLDLRHEGIFIHNFWRSWRIPWNEITEVVVTKGDGVGATWYVPAVRLQNGKERRISSLGSANDQYRAQMAAQTLAAIVDAQRS